MNGLGRLKAEGQVGSKRGDKAGVYEARMRERAKIKGCLKGSIED